jgi:hypothetical protein
MNHGYVTVNEPPVEPRPWIPQTLARILVMEMNIPDEVAIAKYGLWELKCIKEFRAAGQQIKVGDTLSLPGNTATFATLDRNTDFADDKRKKEEEKLLADAARLDMPENIKELAAFATRKKFSDRAS